MDFDSWASEKKTSISVQEERANGKKKRGRNSILLLAITNFVFIFCFLLCLFWINKNRIWTGIFGFSCCAYVLFSFKRRKFRLNISFNELLFIQGVRWVLFKERSAHPFWALSVHAYDLCSFSSITIWQIL